MTRTRTRLTEENEVNVVHILFNDSNLRADEVVDLADHVGVLGDRDGDARDDRAGPLVSLVLRLEDGDDGQRPDEHGDEEQLQPEDLPGQ